MARATVENVNPEVLRQCRKQLNLSLDEVAVKIKSIPAIEEGTKAPTFNQLDNLSELYCVPRWVFISESLPERYQFNTIAAFRQFSEHQDNTSFDSYKIRQLITQVERLRELILELRDDMGEGIEPFESPAMKNDMSAAAAAKRTRQWLGVEVGEYPTFEEWKERLEKKNIFVFMTSKYLGWSYIGDKLNANCRGLSLYHSTLPVIIINASDYRKAQLFTLFHELGHILKEKNEIDVWQQEMPQRDSEKWCDQFAGNVLMPKEEFLQLSNGRESDLDSIKVMAKQFKVSTYACLVRTRQLGIIDEQTYGELQENLADEFKSIKEQQRKKEGGARRDRAKEALDQYGRIYVKTVFQAYHNEAIGLHKLCKSLRLNHAQYALELGNQL